MPASSLPRVAALPTESCVLLLGAQGHQTPQQRQNFVMALSEVREWKPLLVKLHHNGLMPLFIHYTSEIAQDKDSLISLPDDVERVLQHEFSQGLQLRLHLFAELKRVTSLLKARGLAVLAYKGPVMAHDAYGSMSLRPFVDLDLLIDPRHRHDVITLLEENGYEREQAQTLPDRLQQKRVDEDYEISLLARDGVGALDVHWNVRPAYELFPLTFEQMWPRRLPAELDGDIETLCREDLILCLCSHGIKHLWHRLEWITCLAALLEPKRGVSVNWAQLETRANELRSRRIFYLGLRLAIDLSEFGRGLEAAWDVVPPHLRRAVEADRGVTRLARQVWAECLNRQTHEEPALAFSQLLFSLRVRDSWRLRALHLQGVLKKHLLPHHEDAVSATDPVFKIYGRRLSRILVRRLQRWGVIKRA